MTRPMVCFTLEDPSIKIGKAKDGYADIRFYFVVDTTTPVVGQTEVLLRLYADNRTLSVSVLGRRTSDSIPNLVVEQCYTVNEGYAKIFNDVVDAYLKKPHNKVGLATSTLHKLFDQLIELLNHTCIYRNQSYRYKFITSNRSSKDTQYLMRDCLKVKRRGLVFDDSNLKKKRTRVCAND